MLTFQPRHIYCSIRLRSVEDLVRDFEADEFLFGSVICFLCFSCRKHTSLLWGSELDFSAAGEAYLGFV